MKYRFYDTTDKDECPRTFDNFYPLRDAAVCTVRLGDMPARGEPRPAPVDTHKWTRSFDRKCANETAAKEKGKRNVK